MRKLMLALGLLLAGSATVSAEEMRMPLNSDEVKWMAAPKRVSCGRANCGHFRRPIQRWAVRR